MTPNPIESRDRALGGLLSYGTWAASAATAVGLLLHAEGWLKAGVGMFILLPIARVALLLILFLREKDYVYTLISGVVLGIIAIGIVIGVSG